MKRSILSCTVNLVLISRGELKANLVSFEFVGQNVICYGAA